MVFAGAAVLILVGEGAEETLRIRLTRWRSWAGVMPVSRCSSFAGVAAATYHLVSHGSDTRFVRWSPSYNSIGNRVTSCS